MRTLFTSVLIALISVALIGTPTFASPASSPAVPIGVILQAQNNKALADVNSGGVTVYDGDRLETNENESLRVRLGGPQIVLRPVTTAQVHALPNGFSAELIGGTVVVSSTPGQTFQVLTDGATIRPTGTEPTTGQITRASAHEVLLSSTRGTLEVTMGDEVKTVEAGHSYRMEVESEDASGPGPAPQTQHTARNTFLWVAIPVVGAVTAIVVWRALVSPSSN